MKLADLVVVTGSQNNVRAGYASGAAIGVGAGNVVTIIDETADVAAAAEKIAASKTFDNATSCSSENSVIAVDAVYDEVVAALARVGGLLLNATQAERLEQLHWHNGKMTTTLLAQDIDKVLGEMGMLDDAPAGTQFLVAPQSEIGPEHPMTGEKMARFLALHRASNFDEALTKAVAIQSFQEPVTRLVCTQPMMKGRIGWRWKPRRVASSSIRPIVLPPVDSSIMVCPFH